MFYLTRWFKNSSFHIIGDEIKVEQQNMLVSFGHLLADESI